MTTIQSLQSATVGNTTANSSKATISADFDTFLKMLTTQMQNQDPLNPMESTEFATQLATFSGVEQQVKTNDHLAGLSNQLGLANMAQLSGWIGMEARTSGAAEFTGSPLSLHLTPETNAETASLVVTDSLGQEVRRLAVSLPVSEITWAGVSDTGTPLTSGSYSFKLESFAKDGALLGSSPAEHYSRVTEARSGSDGSVQLLMAGGTLIPASMVTALRRP